MKKDKLKKSMFYELSELQKMDVVGGESKSIRLDVYGFVMKIQNIIFG